VRGHLVGLGKRLVSWWLFTLVFGVYAIYLSIWGDPHFYYDAADYWRLGGTFGTSGHFSLLDFDSTLRGYSLPLFNRFLALIASHVSAGSVTIVQIAGSLEIALLGTILVPRVVRAYWPAAHLGPTRVLIFNVIVFLFWRDHLGFPLSDFPAITLAMLALLALSRRSLLGYLVAGGVLGLAWNVRQAYLATLVVVLVIVVCREGIRRTPLRAGAAVAILLAGVAILSLPQTLINHRHVHTWSPVVQGGAGIVSSDLTLGMETQRYETYVGTSFPGPHVHYLDPSTNAIRKEEKITVVRGYSQYAHIFERHPTEMLAAWARRTFNGLDVRYATPYVHDLGSAWEGFSLLDYSLIFVATVRLLVPAFRRRLGRIAWPEAVAICAACVPAIPFAAESRFFLPLQLVIYSLVVFAPGTREGWRSLGRQGQVSLAVAFPIFLLGCIALSTSTVAQISSTLPS
jgi:hypothetical protein